MPTPRLHPIVIADLRGGQNNTDAPLALPANQCTAAVNVDWIDTTFAHKRGGATDVALTGGTTFTAGIQYLRRHVPGRDEGLAELWAIDSAVTPIAKRLVAGTSWANVTVDDTIVEPVFEAVGVTLNGKLFLAYDSAVDRTHVYDPTLAAPRVRRMGFATPGVPTLADQGGGAYPAVLRYYRVRWLQLNGTTVIRRSEPSAAASITPSGAGLSVRVTRPTAAGEGETHWEVEVSLDGATFTVLAGSKSGSAAAAIAIATTFGDDSVATTLYPTYALTDPAGTYTTMPSVRYLLSDGNRLLGLGSWEGGKTARLYYTPVLGSTDQGDDERVPMTTTQKNFVDLNENDGGGGTGLGGPIDGIPYGFKYRQVWKLRPTGEVTAPYSPRKIRDDIGCAAHKTICVGEDQIGRPALYFLSHRGPYRITADGAVEYLGRDNEVTWRTMNLASASASITAHATYYPDKHQWWVWIATGSSSTPDTKMMFDVQLGVPDGLGQIRGGWAVHTGASATANCSCLMSNTLGASMSRDLKPHIGRLALGVTAIWKCDTSATDDAGTAFQAYVTSRPLLTTPDLLSNIALAESTLVGKALAGSDVTVTIVRDFGKETRATAVSLAPAASETRVIKKVEGSEMGEARVLQMTVGDSAANTEVWTVDCLVAPVIPNELA
jgi:hypothetical protein